jgi:hypothetical protein
VTAPRLVDDLSDIDYHKDPALSASGAKLLLPPSSPAHYRWRMDNGPEYRNEFDVGHAAHAAVLGAGADVVIVQKTTRDKQQVDADDYQTKSAQDHRDAIRAEGKVPLLRKEKATVDGMAAALRTHEVASALLDPDHGRPEVSGFWTDERHGVNRRVRFDWLPDSDGGRMLLPDYKSTVCASPAAFRKSAYNYSYPLQAVFYEDGIHAFGLAEDVVFMLIAQEKTPPYEVCVFQFDEPSLRIGREDTDRALSTFAECQATGVWQGYSSEVELLSPPPYLARQYEDVLP